MKILSKYRWKRPQCKRPRENISGLTSHLYLRPRPGMSYIGIIGVFG